VDDLADVRAVAGVGTDRAAAAVALGVGSTRWLAGTQASLSLMLADDSDVRVRAAALSALIRRGSARAARRAWSVAIHDSDAALRRRAVELTLQAHLDVSEAISVLVELLADREPLVAEAAAFALGELEGANAVDPLARVATTHADPLVREAAVAALGAIGDPAGLPAILSACNDKPAIRRRAVLALSPFEGSAVDAAIQRALTDRDWQVRQAAEDLHGS
jgi:HEAT repeat protein